MPASPIMSKMRSAPLRACCQTSSKDRSSPPPPDERRQPPLQRNIEAGDSGFNGVEAVDALRLGLALDRVLAGEGTVDIALDQVMRRLADNDAPGVGQRLQARREMDRIALRREVDALVAANLANDHGTRMHADSNPRRNPELGFQIRGALRHALLDVEAGTTGPHRRVLERHGGAEQRHDAVAAHLGNRAPVFVDGVDHDTEDAVEEAVDLLLTEALGKLGRVHRVGEKDRRGPTMSFEIARR